ncbi:MAG: hypothetical protein M0C28_00530 [Candidatus Moduliflexus flocculans]|nr:hypothetical protein [Candidatus Moduliflexus flocculans]
MRGGEDTAMTEIEVKIRIEDPKAVRERSLGLGAAVVAGTAPRAERPLRLRLGRPGGRGPGPPPADGGPAGDADLQGEPRKSRSFKVREEFETQVRDPQRDAADPQGPGAQGDVRLRQAPDRPAEEPPDHLHRRDGGREFPRARGGTARDRQVRPGPEGHGGRTSSPKATSSC